MLLLSLRMEDASFQKKPVADIYKLAEKSSEKIQAIPPDRTN